MNLHFQIRPQEMSKGCFWVLADEDQYAKPELLNRVALTFGSQRTGQMLLILFFSIVIFHLHCFCIVLKAQFVSLI